MRAVNQSYNTWKDTCQNGSAPQINQASQAVKEHTSEADELLDEMQKANGMSRIRILLLTVPLCPSHQQFSLGPQRMLILTIACFPVLIIDLVVTLPVASCRHCGERPHKIRFRRRRDECSQGIRQ